MKLVTWNVNSLKVRLPRLLELLAEHRPGVVLLQETKTEAAAFPHAELEAAGYHAVEHSAGRWAGVAIAAPLDVPITGRTAGLPGEAAPDEARWLEADVGGLRVASAYVPNGRAPDHPEFANKLAFFDAIAERAAAVDVVAGDLNVTRDDRDVYDPAAFAESTHVTPAERSRLEAILERGGLVDAYRHLHPEDVGYTWWDYRQGHFHRKMGLRIDFVLLREALAARIVSAGIDRTYRKGTKPSDHAPLLVELADAG